MRFPRPLPEGQGFFWNPKSKQQRELVGLWKCRSTPNPVRLGETEASLLIPLLTIGCQARFSRGFGFRVQGSESRVDAKPETLNSERMSVAKRHRASGMPDSQVRRFLRRCAE